MDGFVKRISKGMGKKLTADLSNIVVIVQESLGVAMQPSV